tara:strand:- start:623 stop:1045 length:423 start_codon:yes stop_codon:yes gene_type:complete
MGVLSDFKDEYIDPIKDVFDNPVGDFVTEVIFGADDDDEGSKKSKEDKIDALWKASQEEIRKASEPTAQRVAQGVGRTESTKVITGKTEDVNNTSSLDYVRSEANKLSPQLQKELKDFFQKNKYFVDPDQYASRYRRNRG